MRPGRKAARLEARRFCVHISRIEQPVVKGVTQRAPAPENFTNLITIELKTESDAHRVSGTVFTDKLPRIVNVDGFELEVAPRGHMIYFTNNDKPGVIGNIGTVLGQCNVNIAGMQLGRERQGGRALALLLVDVAVGNDVIGRLLGIENILTARAVKV